MGKIITSYILTTVVFFVIDIIWLGFAGKKIYDKYLGHLLRKDVNWTAGIIFYLLYIAGILIFVVYPAVNKDSFLHSFLFGGLFGLFAYAAYDLTNLATLKNWSLTISIIDILWGVLLTASVSSVSFFIVKMLGF